MVARGDHWRALAEDASAARPAPGSAPQHAASAGGTRGGREPARRGASAAMSIRRVGIAESVKPSARAAAPATASKGLIMEPMRY